jgi:endonuclease YncB( thermonuclease family)
MVMNMKKLLTILLTIPTLAFALATTPPSVKYDYPIARVIDGDTVAFKATFLPPPLKQELSVRIYGVDTPEKGATAKCPAEAAKGAEATAFTKDQVKKSTTKQIAIMKWDKYGGRVLGDVLLDGKSLRDMLIASGLAREYYGGAKASWCK